MTQIRNKDKIHLELAKTYFNNSPRNENLSITQKKRRSSLFIIAILILAGLFPIANYILKLANITITVNVAPNKMQGTRNADLTKTNTIAKPVFKNERVLYNFEKSIDDWEIPAWEFDKDDHVAESLERAGNVSSNGRGSLRLNANFPGARWTAALAEIQQYLNLDNYEQIQADIYLPTTAPDGLKAKLILTVGDEWKFVEMARNVRLEPGRWTTITADLSTSSTDWKRTKIDKNFKEDVRKIAVRIESNNKPVYSGPIYIDNIRASSKKKLN